MEKSLDRPAWAYDLTAKESGKICQQCGREILYRQCRNAWLIKCGCGGVEVVAAQDLDDALRRRKWRPKEVAK